MSVTKEIIITLFVIITLILSGIIGYPHYNVWYKNMKGRALLAEAKHSRLIQIEEAKANLEAQKLNARAEIVRAEGMAKAIEIEGQRLTPVYNQYLYIRNLAENPNANREIIYIPTNGAIPVLDIKE